MSGKTCRFAPVAIDELNVSELYAARQPNPASWKSRQDRLLLGLHLGVAPENRQLTGPLEAAAPGSGLSLRLSLFSYTQTVDDFSVTVGVLPPQIIQQAATLTYHLQQTSPRMVVLDVGFEVIHQAVDPLREQRDLNFRRAGVSRVRFVLTDRFGLCFLCQCHCCSFSSAC